MFYHNERNSKVFSVLEVALTVMCDISVRSEYIQKKSPPIIKCGYFPKKIIWGKLNLTCVQVNCDIQCSIVGNESRS